MRRWILVPVLLLGACGPAPRELTVSAPAPATALTCVQETALELGYTVEDRAPEGVLRVERALAGTESTPYQRWNRIDAAYAADGQLQLHAGTFSRHATRELTGRLIAPKGELSEELRQIEGTCSTSIADV